MEIVEPWAKCSWPATSRLGRTQEGLDNRPLSAQGLTQPDQLR